MDDEISRDVLAIISEQSLLHVDDISRRATADDLGLDSLAVVEVVFELEERFDVSIPYNANSPQASGFQFTTVEDVIEEVKRLVAEKG